MGGGLPDAPPRIPLPALVHLAYWRFTRPRTSVIPWRGTGPVPRDRGSLRAVTALSQAHQRPVPSRRDSRSASFLALRLTCAHSSSSSVVSRGLPTTRGLFARSRALSLRHLKPDRIKPAEHRRPWRSMGVHFRGVEPASHGSQLRRESPHGRGMPRSELTESRRYEVPVAHVRTKDVLPGGRVNSMSIRLVPRSEGTAPSLRKGPTAGNGLAVRSNQFPTRGRAGCPE